MAQKQMLRVGKWAIAAPLFDFLAPDWLHKNSAVFRCALIGFKDDLMCCDVLFLIGCAGAEGSFAA
jgi:hypothetical protein